MRFFQFLFALAAIVAATIGAETWLGKRTHRVKRAQMLAAAAEKLQLIPTAIGDWQMEASREFPRLVLETLENPTYVCRSYKNQRTGRSVELTLLVGPSGPLVAHRPEICIDGQGHRIVRGPELAEFGESHDLQQLFRTTFARLPAAGQFVIYYGWTRGRGCEAPEWPRLALGREPALYKLQVAANLEPFDDKRSDQDPGRQFLSEFLPVLDKIVSGPTEAPSRPASTSTLR
jgi:hypothetical protein